MNEKMENNGVPNHEIDWDSALAFLRSAVRRYCHRYDDFLLDDLTQEALVRLHRAVCRELPDNLDAFMNTIARRTVLDHLRRRQVQDRVFAPLIHDNYPGKPAELDTSPEIDPMSRIRFLVIQYFAHRHPGCANLAKDYFRKKKWPDIAKKLGVSPVAVRKRWSRCLEQLKTDAVHLPDIMRLSEFCP